MNDPTVIVAVAGLVTTLLGALAAPILTARQAHRNVLNQERRDVYRDALMHAVAADQTAQDATDMLRGAYRYRGAGKLVPAAIEDITSRLQLYGTPQAQEAFATLLLALELVNFEFSENGVQEEGLAQDDSIVLGLREAAAGVRSACQLPKR